MPTPEPPLDTTPPEPSVPVSGRLMAVDYGTKRLGFAVSNAEQTIASPVENYTRQTLAIDAKCVQRLVSEYRIVGLVVGLPVHLSGQDSQKSLQARAFGTWLNQVTNLPVVYSDERYSSSFAEEHLMSLSFTKKKRKARLDMLAAQVILQGFIEGKRNADPGALAD